MIVPILLVVLAVVLFFGGLALFSLWSFKKAARAGDGRKTDEAPTETRTGPPSGGHEA
jgi:hypothetical protein